MIVLLTLLSCTHPTLLPTDQLAVPGAGVGPRERGQTWTYRVDAVPPGARLFLLLGQQATTGPATCAPGGAPCSTLAVDQVVGPERPTAGEVTFQVTLPDASDVWVELVGQLGSVTRVSPPARFAIDETCDDGVDNDDDGLVDCEDAECASACEESSCDDGLDDDRDGLVDCADDDCFFVDVCPRVVHRVTAGRFSRVQTAEVVPGSYRFYTFEGSDLVLTGLEGVRTRYEGGLATSCAWTMPDWSVFRYQSSSRANPPTPVTDSGCAVSSSLGFANLSFTRTPLGASPPLFVNGPLQGFAPWLTLATTAYSVTQSPIVNTYGSGFRRTTSASGDVAGPLTGVTSQP